MMAQMLRSIHKKDLYFFLFLAAYTGYLVLLAVNDYIWLDEGYSLVTSARSAGYAFEKALTFEMQPPLYYVMLSLWRDLGNSIAFARILSLLLLLLMVIPLKAFFKRLFGSRHQLFTVVFITSPLVLTTALEIRYPILVFLLTVLIEYLFLITYYKGKPGIWLRVSYVAVAILGVYTQYYMAFLLVANFFVLLLQNSQKALRRYLPDMIWPVAALALLLPYLEYQINHSSSYCSLEVNPKFFLSFFYHHIKYLVISAPLYSNEFIRGVLRPIFLGLLILPVFLRPVKSFISNVLKSQYLHKIIILLILYAFLAMLLNVKLLYVRYLTLAFVVFWILGLTVLNQLRNQKLVTILSILFIGLSLGYFTWCKVSQPRGQKYKEIAQYIMENEKPGQPILVYKNQLTLVLNPVYEGKNKIHPIPQEVSPEEAYNLKDWAIDNRREVDSLFKAHNKNKLWLITTNNSWLERRHCIDYNDEILNRYVMDHFDILSEKTIEGILIQRLVWKPTDTGKQ
jgi:uncharacterized membrane protein